MYYSVKNIAELYGATLENMHAMIKIRPLPPSAILLDTKRVAWDKERVDWYIANRNKIKPWATPWDNTPPKEYWSKQTIARALDTQHGYARKLLTRNHLEPEFVLDRVSWYSKALAQDWVEKNYGFNVTGRIKNYRSDKLVTRARVAKMLGVSADTARDYKLPAPDTIILTGADPIPVWHMSTIQQWDRGRKESLRRTSKQL